MSEIVLEQLDQYRYRIPRSAAVGMRTDVIVYATRKLLDQIKNDQSLIQAMNVAMLPGITGPSLAMPDIHQGYGFPIGGIAATDFETGLVSPGGVGFDINCGVRLVSSTLSKADVQPRLKQLVDQLFRDIPCGAGTAGRLKLKRNEADRLLERGAQWMVEHGYGEPSDAERTEASGALTDACPEKVSERAKERGVPQLGTLGSGNHFLEIQYVDRVHDAAAARAMGIESGQVVVLIHSGSRGLGHQVCTDYVALMNQVMPKYGIHLPDRQLACAPVQSPEGLAYLGAMAAAANFAWANRQGILHFLRHAFRRVFGDSVRLATVYDVCHNIGRREQHLVHGSRRDLLVHRKGATRAFPPGHPEVPPAYAQIGQPAFVPGSMDTSSWVLAGEKRAMQETFGSVCHGAGRLLSPTAVRKGKNAEEERRKLEQNGILVRSKSRDGVLEELPEAYKDVDEVIEVVHNAGLAKKVARLRPMGVIKG
jgi:tRNA-splicing ligase RtcB